MKGISCQAAAERNPVIKPNGSPTTGIRTIFWLGSSLLTGGFLKNSRTRATVLAFLDPRKRPPKAKHLASELGSQARKHGEYIIEDVQTNGRTWDHSLTSSGSDETQQEHSLAPLTALNVKEEGGLVRGLCFCSLDVNAIFHSVAM